MTEWQPIETAPKDGTWIMLWRGPHVKGWVWSPLIIGRWSNGEAAWAWPDTPDYDPWHDLEYANRIIASDRIYFAATGFSHWMPLPLPPSDISPEEIYGGEGIS